LSSLNRPGSKHSLRFKGMATLQLLASRSTLSSLGRARFDIDQALALSPKREKLLWTKVRICKEAEDWSTMIETLKMIVELNPDNAHAWSQLGAIQIQQGVMPEGIASLRQAQRIGHAAELGRIPTASRVIKP